jgi:hypothetical protein
VYANIKVQRPAAVKWAFSTSIQKCHPYGDLLNHSKEAKERGAENVACRVYQRSLRKRSLSLSKITKKRRSPSLRTANFPLCRQRIHTAKRSEKGNAENKAGWVRRNLLAPVPAITGFGAFNAELLPRCDEGHEREHCQHDRHIEELW